MTRQDIHDQVAAILQRSFGVPAERIVPQADLFRDLDIDSIDAVDLLAEARQLIGRRISTDDFRKVRTVQDVVDALERIGRE